MGCTKIEITQVLDRIRMEHIEPICSLESWLHFYIKYSTRTRSRTQVINKIDHPYPLIDCSGLSVSLSSDFRSAASEISTFCKADAMSEYYFQNISFSG